MAFSFDSPFYESLGALVLLAAGVWCWWMACGLRAAIRVQLRFAAVLLAAFAASLPMPAPGLASNVLLLTSSVASAALVLACFRRPAPAWLAATMLAGAFAMGLFASLAATPFPALVSVGGAALSISGLSISRMKEDAIPNLAAMLGAVSLLLAAMAIRDGGLFAAALFFASALGLVARGLEKPVKHPNPRIELLIG